MSKNILYVWKSEYPWDVRVEKICNSLKESGFNVVILARWKAEEKQFEIINGIKVVRVGFKKPSFYSTPISGNPVWHYWINKIVKDEQIDLIISREIMLAAVCNKVAKDNGIKNIIDMAENYPALMKLWKKYNKSFISKFLFQTLKIADKIELNVTKNCDGIIVVCKEQIERLRSLNYQKSFAVVHNTNPLNYSNEVNRNYENLKSFKFIHHGYLTAEKKIDSFLRAFLIALDIKSNMEFTILGEGDCLQELKDIVSENKNGIHTNKVNFQNKYEHSELKEILMNHHIGVIPYQKNDFNNYTIHNKIFDFFSYGMPVIASDTEPFTRLINETKAGISVDIENVESLSENILNLVEMDLQTFSNNSLKAAKEKYNWENDSQTLINYINETVNA